MSDLRQGRRLMILFRLLTVALLIAASYGFVHVVERVRGSRRQRVPAGLTLVSSPACRDCSEARRRLDLLGARYRVVGVDDASVASVASYTLPYAIVGSSVGDLVMVRRGRSVITDAEALVAAGMSAIVGLAD